VYSAPGEIQLDTLPEAFILKATHGSGWNVMCRARASFDFAAAAARLSRYLRTSYYDMGREWIYKDLTPRIVCQPLLLDAAGEVPQDYKFFCFHGEPRVVQVDWARFRAHTQNLYDTDWRLLPCRKRYPNNAQAPRHPPATLPEMLEISRQLAKPFPFVRVDLYAIEGRVFFGELTFLPYRGVIAFKPRSFEYAFGRMLDLGRIHAHVV
jgi:hypothetical protein